jgi:hypothetical protein
MFDPYPPHLSRCAVAHCQGYDYVRGKLKIPGGSMPKEKDKLKTLLQRDREVHVSVIGRKSGKVTTRPVWFVLEQDKLFLLPVQGSETQWYENLMRNPWIQISTRSAAEDFQATLVTDPKAVSSVAEKFRKKYGAADVKKYYSKFDVAVVVNLFGDESAAKQK